MIGSGGEPLRYGYTSVGYCSFSPWIVESATYSMLQLNQGSNPLSKLEVVSTLNTLSQACDMYYYNYGAYPAKYAPKVYFSTLQTIAANWLYNNDTYWDITQKMNWPQAFQGSQKGEANTEGN